MTRLHLAQEYWNLGMADKAVTEAESGHVLAKDINALALLRDYAILLAEMEEAAGNELRAQYHRDQFEWLEKRIRTGKGTPPPRVEDVVLVDRTAQDMLPVAQTSAFVVLGVLILVLILENARLRHHRR